eukprot:EG_transcript_40131
MPGLHRSLRLAPLALPARWLATAQPLCGRGVAGRRWLSVVTTGPGPEGGGAPTPTLEEVARQQELRTQSGKQIGGPGLGPPDADMAAMFTCGACETRVLKTFTRHSYEKGVVIVECPGCHNLHVLADNLGWFGDEKNVEEILRAKGEEVRRGRVV